MKTIKYGFFALIVAGIFSLLFVAINRNSSNRHTPAPAESNTSTPAESGVQEKLEALTEPTNNIRTNRTVTFTISPKFGGFRKQ
jgi:hypothetical protein